MKIKYFSANYFGCKKIAFGCSNRTINVSDMIYIIYELFLVASARFYNRMPKRLMLKISRTIIVTIV